MDMKCKAFQANLDAYIDSELDIKTRKAMEEHALHCDECAERLDTALQLATMCAELNEGLVVPESVSQAWRAAIREEADGGSRSRRARRRPARHSGFVRALAGLAAVLVLTVAIGSQMSDGALRLGPVTGDGRTAYRSSAPAADYEGGAYSASETAAGYGKSNSVTLESDGSAGGTLSITGESDDQLGGVVIIRSASREIRSDAFSDDTLLIDDLVSEYGAYYESKRITGTDSKRLDAVVRVPSESLDRFLTALDVVGTVISREDSAEDVTDQYVDMNARLTVLRGELEQLNAMTASAQNVSELIEINERAAEVTAEIEAYEAGIKSIQNRQRYSSVRLTMSEAAAPAPDEPDKPLTERMGDAFRASVEWLKGFGQDAAVFGASLAPRLVIWVPVAIIVIILLKVAFGRKKKNKK